ncbi:MAG: hypothetical protein L0H26_11100, partial [Microlunatus sp.]|nr:hypothetical protein [Microlunatus sp.]
MTAATPDRREPIRSPAWFAAAVAAVFAVAVAVRLGSLLRGGGLYGLGNYDDGVHFAAAVGLINGLLPYRDFLLLHPPGVVLALAPFAWLSWAIGEPDAMAVARLSWILLGGVNAALCALVIRPIGRLAAVFAGLVYALMLGAVYVEHTTLLEPPATTLLLLALVITRLLGSDSGITTRHYVIAGLLLGLSPVLKIWGVLAVLVVVGGIVGRRGLRSGLMTLAAAVGSCAAVCLPFFLAAPDQMWRMVVVAQLGRRRAPGSLVRRLDDITGISRWSTGVPQWTALLVVVLALLLVAFVICLIRAELRLVAALLVSHLAIVLSTPMWFLHYAGLSAAPIALTLGGALGAVMTWTRSIRWLPGVLATAAILATLLLAYPLTTLSLGNKAFPGK